MTSQSLANHEGALHQGVCMSSNGCVDESYVPRVLLSSNSTGWPDHERVSPGPSACQDACSLPQLQVSPAVIAPAAVAAGSTCCNSCSASACFLHCMAAYLCIAPLCTHRTCALLQVLHTCPTVLTAWQQGIPARANELQKSKRQQLGGGLSVSTAISQHDVAVMLACQILLHMSMQIA